MKSLFLLSLCLWILMPAKSQSLFLNLDAGAANYEGDLQSKRYTFQESHPGVGIGLGYDLDPHITLSTEILYTRISGDDKYQRTAIDRQRNLNFTTNILEWNVRAEYALFDLNERRITPYGFLGLAIFHFNPYTFDSTGKKVFLKPLSTEGEGLPAYPSRKPYALVQPAIPFGIGVRGAVTDNIRVGLEIGLRKTFTGYLDDVHSTYVDYNTLLAAKGQEAVALAYRTNELPVHGNTPYPAAGTQRGGGKDDWYYFTGVRVSIRLGGSTGSVRHMRCPVFRK